MPIRDYETDWNPLALQAEFDSSIAAFLKIVFFPCLDSIVRIICRALFLWAKTQCLAKF
jgi:hypothetical protein